MKPVARLFPAAVLAAALLATAGALSPGVAAAQDEVPDTPAWRSNVGLVTGIGVALMVPDEGSAGVGVELAGRYGIPAGPVVLGPGALLGGYYLQERFIGVLMPTFRVTLPLGPFAPFGHGGAGGGLVTNPGEGGVAWLGGGGLMIHFDGLFSLGVEVNYQGITSTDYRALSIGPTIIVGG